MLYIQEFKRTSTCEVSVSDKDVDFWMEHQRKRREDMLAKELTPKWELSSREKAIAIMLENAAYEYLEDESAGAMIGGTIVTEE